MRKHSWLKVDPYIVVDEVSGRVEVAHYLFLCAALLTQMAQVEYVFQLSLMTHSHHGQA